VIYPIPLSHAFSLRPAIPQIGRLRIKRKEAQTPMKWLVNEQEVIVLGSGLGGLVAGTLLSKSNHSVLLLREKGYLSSCAIQGYHFIPFSNLSEKCLKPSLIRKISQALGISLLLGAREDGKQPKVGSDRSRHGSTLQVVLPKARIDIFPQRPQSQREWKREFPREVSQIEGFYQELDRIQDLFRKGDGIRNPSEFSLPFRERSFIKRIWSSDPYPNENIDKKLLPFSKEFKQFIQLQLISWGNFYSDRFPISLAAHVLFDETNESNLDLDREKLEREILNQFTRSGGRVEDIDRVKEVKPWRRKGIALNFEGNSGVFQSQCLIINCPLHRIVSFLGKKGKGLLKWEKRIKPLYVVTPLFLGIQEKVIPVGMKDHLISFLDLEKPYEDGNLLLLSMSPKGDKTRAPEDRRALTVEGLIDAGKWDQIDLASYKEKVMKHLYHLFPFLENYIELVDFEWIRDQFSKWSYSHFIYGSTSDFYWREGMVPTRISENTYFIGKENFPYWGLAGEVFSGLTVARQILKKYS
jgi:phytoene dehydrogenase-like protein